MALKLPTERLTKTIPLSIVEGAEAEIYVSPSGGDITEFSSKTEESQKKRAKMNHIEFCVMKSLKSWNLEDEITSENISKLNATDIWDIMNESGWQDFLEKAGQSKESPKVER